MPLAVLWKPKAALRSPLAVLELPQTTASLTAQEAPPFCGSAPLPLPPQTNVNDAAGRVASASATAVRAQLASRAMRRARVLDAIAYAIQCVRSACVMRSSPDLPGPVVRELLGPANSSCRCGANGSPGPSRWRSLIQRSQPRNVGLSRGAR